MAINVWEIFQPVFRRNRHNFLLVIRKRGMLTVARRYHERTATQTTEQFGAVGSQMKETAHDREDSNRNKLAITGKLCYYRPVWLQEPARVVWTFRPRGSYFLITLDELLHQYSKFKMRDLFRVFQYIWDITLTEILEMFKYELTS